MRLTRNRTHREIKTFYVSALFNLLFKSTLFHSIVLLLIDKCVFFRSPFGICVIYGMIECLHCLRFFFVSSWTKPLYRMCVSCGFYFYFFIFLLLSSSFQCSAQRSIHKVLCVCCFSTSRVQLLLVDYLTGYFDWYVSCSFDSFENMCRFLDRFWFEIIIFYYIIRVMRHLFSFILFLSFLLFLFLLSLFTFLYVVFPLHHSFQAFPSVFVHFSSPSFKIVDRTVLTHAPRTIVHEIYRNNPSETTNDEREKEKAR